VQHAVELSYGYGQVGGPRGRVVAVNVRLQSRFENVPWTYDEIEADWLGGASIRADPESVVAAFERTERVLGRDWIEGRRARQGGVFRGAPPTLSVVWAGMRLAYVEDVPGIDELVRDLRADKAAAWAEVTAVYLLRAAAGLTVELASIIEPIDREFTIEVFFRRTPLDSEVAELLPQVEVLCARDGTTDKMLVIWRSFC
jgi:hypothetical protein